MSRVINTISDITVKISDACHKPYQISLNKLDDTSIPP
jgi:hypothetical protein